MYVSLNAYKMPDFREIQRKLGHFQTIDTQLLVSLLKSCTFLGKLGIFIAKCKKLEDFKVKSRKFTYDIEKNADNSDFWQTYMEVLQYLIRKSVNMSKFQGHFAENHENRIAT